MSFSLLCSATMRVLCDLIAITIEEGETEAITIGVMVVNSNRKGNLANSWEEKALKVRLEMLSMADGEKSANTVGLRINRHRHKH